MKCLTICEPYATLIMLSDDDPRAKRIENRPRPFSYRGTLLIHAGKSRDWMDSYTMSKFWLKESELTFGAILGVATLAGCCRYSHGIGVGLDEEIELLLKSNQLQHMAGPYCLVLKDVHRFEKPILHRGAQGLFDVPDEIVAEQLRKAGVECLE